MEKLKELEEIKHPIWQGFKSLNLIFWIAGDSFCDLFTYSIVGTPGFIDIMIVSKKALISLFS